MQSISRQLKSYGFSLVEILVVLVIIAITVTMALYAFGDFGRKKNLDAIASNVISHIKLAHEYAVIDGSTLLLEMSGNSYQIKKYTPKNGWVIPTTSAIFRKVVLPKNFHFQSDKKNLKILLYSSGDITPFNILLEDKKGKSRILITGTISGNISKTTKT